ncbi:acyloxyacyl hydrolase [Desulfosarcina variabilis]|uniref:acyloxyacyl hydrolase n=1 Tax=Desulfosarcina variabilis TaxID=2300 RepID=UPI003AFB5402
MSCRRVVTNSSWSCGLAEKGQGRRCYFPCMVLGTVLLLLIVGGDAVNAFDVPSPARLMREMRFGVAAHDVDGLWSGDSKEKGPDLCAEVLFNRSLLDSLFDWIDIGVYPNAGISINTRGDTSKVYGGFRLEWQPLTALMLSTGLGLALHNGKRDTDLADRKSLGAQVLFRIPIEIGWVLNSRYRLVLAFDHISNAYLFSPNQGMDTLGVMVGYRF